MATLSGSIVNLLGNPGTFPNGSPVRAFLHPPFPITTTLGDVRLGGLELTLSSTGAFSQSGLPTGEYVIEVLHYDGTGPASALYPVVVG
jgi:hypothetical protein